MKLFISILLVLIVPIFGISNNDKNDQIGSKSQTVKDQFGIDTGMTKEELEKFKEEYLKLDKKMFPGTQSAMLYNFRINLNKYNELKEAGVDLKRSGVPVEGKTYKENALYSDMIIIGKTIKHEKLMEKVPVFKIEVVEVIKGKNILIKKFGKIPEYFHYHDETSWSNSSEPVFNKLGVYYFNHTEEMFELPDRIWSRLRPSSTLICLEDSIMIYERHKHYINTKMKPDRLNPAFVYSDDWKRKLKFSEVILNIKEILKINDDKDFYKNIWK